MSERLGRNYFKKDTLWLAKDFLGKYLVRKIGRRSIVARIVETEAYLGPRDRAAHSFNHRRTKRTEVEYREGGHVYIYLVYGMHWQLNIVTSAKEKPECVLIRAVEIFKNNHLLDGNIANGPGKLCKILKLDKSFYGEDLCVSKRIYLEDHGEKIKSSNIIASKRIGIDYAGHYWANKKWRFYIKESSVKK